LRSGESIVEALEAIKDYPISGLLFNCSFPETITHALPLLQGLSLPYGGYANGFTSVDPLKPGGTVDALSAREDLDETAYTDHIMNWIKQGATIVGGCCEVGPSYIAHIRDHILSTND
jgi:S-methylmethionine-dependent homocysteine/selenocysteine methylase